MTKKRVVGWQTQNETRSRQAGCRVDIVQQKGVVWTARERRSGAEG